MVQRLVLVVLVVDAGTRWIGMSFSLLYFRIGGSVSFLLHVFSFPIGDEKVVHVDIKCILSFERMLQDDVVQLVHAWRRFSLQWLDFEACSEIGMFTMVWLCINWFVNQSLTVNEFSLDIALVKCAVCWRFYLFLNGLRYPYEFVFCYEVLAGNWHLVNAAQFQGICNSTAINGGVKTYCNGYNNLHLTICNGISLHWRLHRG